MFQVRDALWAYIFSILFFPSLVPHFINLLHCWPAASVINTILYLTELISRSIFIYSPHLKSHHSFPKQEVQQKRFRASLAHHPWSLNLNPVQVKYQAGTQWIQPKMNDERGLGQEGKSQVGPTNLWTSALLITVLSGLLVARARIPPGPTAEPANIPHPVLRAHLCSELPLHQALSEATLNSAISLQGSQGHGGHSAECKQHRGTTGPGGELVF